MGLWFGGVLLIGGAVFAVSLFRLTTGQNVGMPVSETTNLVGLIVPLAMLAFGIALVAFGRHLARDEWQFLLGFLRDTIDAREV